MEEESVTSEQTAGLVIAVNRSVRPVYPPLIKRIMVPELESTGPDRFDVSVDLTVLTCAARPGYKLVVAQDVAHYLIQQRMLPACLGIHDGIAIQNKGIEVFRAIKNILQLDEIHLWRSIGADGTGSVEPGMVFGLPSGYLPTVLERDNAVVIEWRKFSECKWFKYLDIVYFKALLPNDLVIG